MATKFKYCNQTISPINKETKKSQNQIKLAIHDNQTVGDNKPINLKKP